MPVALRALCIAALHAPGHKHATTTSLCPSAGELPTGVDKVAFAWERGLKVFVTDSEPVNPHTRAVFWKQFLRQVTLHAGGQLASRRKA